MKMGLPDVRDPDRLQEIEKILQEMTEAGRLTFYPPDRYAIKTQPSIARFLRTFHICQQIPPNAKRTA